MVLEHPSHARPQLGVASDFLLENSFDQNEIAKLPRQEIDPAGQMVLEGHRFVCGADAMVSLVEALHERRHPVIHSKNHHFH